MQDSDRKLLKSLPPLIADALIAFISTHQPGLGIPLLVCMGLANSLMGSAVEIRQNRALEFIEIIRDNPGIFTTELLKTEEFQDGFVYALEKYIRERNRKKRSIAQRIFIGFASSEVKEQFQLERYYNILSLLSVETLEYLFFLQKEVMPNYYQEIDRKAQETVESGAENGADFWIKIRKRDYPLSKHIENQIYTKYNPNSPRVEQEYSLDRLSKDKNQRLKVDAAFERASEQEDLWDKAKIEFISLGFLSINTLTSGTIGEGEGIKYNITVELERFLKFIENKT